MNQDQIVHFLQQYLPTVGVSILSGLGALVVLGFAYVKMTPTQDDDQWLQKLEEKAVFKTLLGILLAFAPIQRKEEPPTVEPKKDDAKTP